MCEVLLVARYQLLRCGSCCFRRYYEFEVITPGYMKVGWSKVNSDPSKELGLDNCSYVFDGFGVSRIKDFSGCPLPSPPVLFPWDFFNIMRLVGTSDKKDTVVRSQGELRGPDSPPVTMQYVYTVEHQIYVLHASDLAPLSSFYATKHSSPGQETNE